MDLAEWLLARVDEDESSARLTGRLAWMESSSGVLETGDWPDGVHALGDASLTRFMAEWDPARVLAECEAKRRIVALHSRGGEYGYADRDGQTRRTAACNTCGSAGEYDEPWPCDTLRLLALPYADREGYDEAWRP